jgi:hypothetical protein
MSTATTKPSNDAVARRYYRSKRRASQGARRSMIVLRCFTARRSKGIASATGADVRYSTQSIGASQALYTLPCPHYQTDARKSAFTCSEKTEKEGSWNNVTVGMAEMEYTGSCNAEDKFLEPRQPQLSVDVVPSSNSNHEQPSVIHPLHLVNVDLGTFMYLQGCIVYDHKLPVLAGEFY